MNLLNVKPSQLILKCCVYDDLICNVLHNILHENAENTEDVSDDKSDTTYLSKEEDEVDQVKIKKKRERSMYLLIIRVFFNTNSSDL